MHSRHTLAFQICVHQDKGRSAEKGKENEHATTQKWPWFLIGTFSSIEDDVLIAVKGVCCNAISPPINAIHLCERQVGSDVQ